MATVNGARRLGLRALWPLIWREWQHHPWRQAVAAAAIAMGVALAWSVQVIHASALAEFSAAVNAANGQPDAVLRGLGGAFDDIWLDRIAARRAVRQASGLLELNTHARTPSAARQAVRVFGIDSLSLAPLAPALIPNPAQQLSPDANRLALVDPQRAFVNAAAREGLRLRDGDPIALQAGQRWVEFTVSGSVAAAGSPLVVIDISAAQAHFDAAGRLSRIDVRLHPGHDVGHLAAELPPELRLARTTETESRVSNLSRAYRVNLNVLALVALLVGSFLVYSVVALSVAQRTAQLALLGVLGMTDSERRRLVMTESLLLGVAGSAVGLLLGTAMAGAAMHWLAGDLGAGYFGATASTAPRLSVQPLALLAFGLMGVAAAAIGAWLPAREAERLQPAQALKGLGSLQERPMRTWPAPMLCAAAALLAALPPLGDLPLAAYASVAAWLFGGVAAVPLVVSGLLASMPAPRGALPRLALERARFERHAATAAVAGVVASLALSVALTVMVTSFRAGVTQWLDQVLPADLYARSAANSALAEQAWLPPDILERASELHGVRQVKAARSVTLSLAPGRPDVTLTARELGDPASTLPLLDAPLPARADETGVFVSEAMVALYGARPGTELALPLLRDGRAGPASVRVRVRGVWRDYARQFGTVAIDRADYRRLTGDARINDLALWLQPGADRAAVQRGLLALAQPAPLDFASTPELKRISLAIFDRSFAVTGWLQAVAIAIGLVGVAASLSAQVLARRKEFGLLAHLGLTGGQVMRLVAGETAAWLAAGCLVGAALGAVISAVLVHVVNPQSFHWTMDIVWPWGRLALLVASVMAAGIATATWASRHALSRPAVLSVREDW